MFRTLQQILPLTIIITIVRIKAEPPVFRILAPEFVCPEDEEATLVKPDNTIITIRTKAGAKLHMSWIVRWSPLPAPAQRSTLLLWRASRALEKKLNGPQPEPFVYVIKNDELLPGINYIFNVTASNSEGERTLKSFHINNVQGDQKLEHIEGRADLLSVLLVGGQETYADVEFAMEALVTTCYPTQDYYFDWTIQSTETDDKVDTELTSSRLEIPANSLRAGLTYLVTCQVVRQSNGDFITQISPLPRVLNEGTRTVLVANVSNVTPLCSLTWYFAKEEYLLSQNHVVNDSCDDCQHGEPLTETLTIYSVEENFLDELSDFTNETEWRQVTAEMPAAEGRARFVAQCECSFTFACDSQGTVFADMFFKLNEIPKANDVMVAPESGSALETIFRVSTLAAADSNSPLQYTFYCRVGVNSTMALGSYTEHMAVETFLPYIVDGTEVWVEVCDVLGACARSASKVVPVCAGDGATIAALLEDTLAHIRRCELEELQRVAVAAVVTYKNAGQSEAFEQFCTNLLTALPMMQEDCLKRKSEKYFAFLIQLVEVGCDASPMVDDFGTKI